MQSMTLSIWRYFVTIKKKWKYLYWEFYMIIIYPRDDGILERWNKNKSEMLLLELCRSMSGFSISHADYHIMFLSRWIVIEIDKQTINNHFAQPESWALLFYSSQFHKYRERTFIFSYWSNNTWNSVFSTLFSDFSQRKIQTFCQFIHNVNKFDQAEKSQTVSNETKIGGWREMKTRQKSKIYDSKRKYGFEERKNAVKSKT